MNKRLLLALYDRSGLGAYMPVDYNGHELEVEKHMEKFAELIVQEFVRRLREEGELAKIQASVGSTYRFAYLNESANIIKQHFGVDKE